MDYSGIRLQPHAGFRVDPGMVLYIKAYRIPKREHILVDTPWWHLYLWDHTRDTMAERLTIWEGGEIRVCDLQGGTYSIRPENHLRYESATLDIHYALLFKMRGPLRRPRMDENKSDYLGNATDHCWGRSLHLVDVAHPFLWFQPEWVVHGDGRGFVTLEHSDDEEEWEPLYHGGFPGGKMVIDQRNIGALVKEPMILTGAKKYVRWMYTPLSILGWGFGGQFAYTYSTRHGR